MAGLVSQERTYAGYDHRGNAVMRDYKGKLHYRGDGRGLFVAEQDARKPHRCLIEP